MAMPKDSMRNKFLFIIVFISFSLIVIVINLKGGIQAMEIKQSNQEHNDKIGLKKLYFYLVASSLSPLQLNKLPLSEIPLQEPAFITSDDIQAYSINTHTFMLNDKAFDKIRKLEIPVKGRAFIVSVDDRRIYMGAFWTILSSIPYDGIVIMKPLDVTQNQELKIQMGCPTEKFFKGQDLRDDHEILEVLAGKIPR